MKKFTRATGAFYIAAVIVPGAVVALIMVVAARIMHVHMSGWWIVPLAIGVMVNGMSCYLVLVRLLDGSRRRSERKP